MKRRESSSSNINRNDKNRITRPSRFFTSAMAIAAYYSCCTSFMSQSSGSTVEAFYVSPTVSYHPRAKPQQQTKRREKMVLQSSLPDDNEHERDIIEDTDQAELEFFEDFLKYAEQKVSDALSQKHDTFESMQNKRYNKWQLLDWQMRCGSRYRQQRMKADKKLTSANSWQRNYNKLAKERSRNSALCIVPCESSAAWDTIQRFRFFCRDSRLYFFPPSINLFHPFAPPESLLSAASATGNLIQMMPSSSASRFTIRLDRVVLIVNRDALRKNDNSNHLISRSNIDTNLESLQQQEVLNLIKNEEQKGKERRLKRLLREKEDALKDGAEFPARLDNELDNMIQRMDINANEVDEEISEKENDLYNFVGNENAKIMRSPCLLCLAPDQESAVRIRDLREILCNEMFGCYNKPNGIFRHAAVLDLDFALDKGFSSNFTGNGDIQGEPLLVLGQFRTALKASHIGKLINDEVKKIGSITFDANDLQFISNEDKDNNDTLTSKERSRTTAKVPFGVDAKVSLVNIEEEIDLESFENPSENDDLDFDEIFSSLIEVAETEAKTALMIWSREERQQLGIDDELYLDFFDESVEEWNEGSTITIGRTQFFIGEKREYHGMPAANPMDRKRTLGEDFMSGATRRKGARHGALRWSDGDFGYKDEDEA